MTAVAQQLSTAQKERALERLHAADINGDGFIDQAEADAKLPRVAKRFTQLDSNADGKLSPDELKAAAAQFAQRRQ